MSDSIYEEQLKAANEAVYKHSLELARLKQELELTNERQEGLLHFIGHEVKGYLTKDMAAFAALAEGDVCALPDNAKPFIQSALTQTRQGVQAVTDLLEASNQKKGTVSYKMESFDFKDLVQEVIERARPIADTKHLTFELKVEEADSYQIHGDREKLGIHVLRNLVENALNYTLHGSVTVSIAKRAGKIEFTVADTGVGISAEDKARLFTEGGRGKDSIKVNVHSTGYGLFIAKSIVEAHKGTIHAESEGPGKGSRFVVELPI